MTDAPDYHMVRGEMWSASTAPGGLPRCANTLANVNKSDWRKRRLQLTLTLLLIFTAIALGLGYLYWHITGDTIRW